MSPARSLVFVSLLLLGSCLQVESTEVRVVADTKNDRLDVMIVSRGVSSNAGNEKNLQKDLADLRSCRDGACVIAPGLGVMDFARQEAAKDEATAAARQRFVSLLDFESGAFFVDEAGRLSFYQFVRIHRLTEFEALCNERALATIGDRKGISAETAALLEKARQDGAKMVTIDGAGFRIRRPLSTADHHAERDKLWHEIVLEIVKALERRPDDQTNDAVARALEQSGLRAFRDNDMAIVRHHDATEYFVGTQGSEVCDYRMGGDEYKDNLLVALTAEEPRPPIVTQALVEKQFTAFRTREARLPTAYAEIKQRSTLPQDR